MLVSDFHWVVVHHFGDPRWFGSPHGPGEWVSGMANRDLTVSTWLENLPRQTSGGKPLSQRGLFSSQLSIMNRVSVTYKCMSRVYKCIQSSWTMISKLQLPPAKRPLCTPQDVGRGMSWLTYHENWQLTPKITTFRSLRITKQSHHQIDPHSIYL